MQVILLVLVISACLHRITLAVNVVTDKKLERRKRYLAFPKGSSLQLVYCFLVAALGSQNIFTVGITLGLAWEIPTNLATQLASKTPHHLHRRQARDLYPRLEAFLHKLGVNGRACVMRAICDAMYRNASSLTFAEEMVHTIFTYPAADEVDNESVENELQSSAYDSPRHNASLCIDYIIDCPIPLLDFNFIS